MDALTLLSRSVWLVVSLRSILRILNETTMVPGAAKTATRAIAVAQSRVLKRDDAMLPRWYELSRDYMEPA
jgi:hypothetical protein